MSAAATATATGIVADAESSPHYRNAALPA